MTSPLSARLRAHLGTAGVRAGVAAELREALDAGRDRARARLEAGGGGVEVARLYCAAADDVLTALWDFTAGVLYPANNPTEGERLALLAVGGYGRGVLAPFSDLDLLFLRPWKTSPRGESVVEFMLYVLWDMGLKVGWASRSVDDSLKLARRDMVVRTTLLEARPLAGDERLAAAFQRKFRRNVRRADARPFIAAKLDERDVRHRKAGEVRYRVEPNVKDGKGGLRDLNTLFWIARHLAPESPLGESALESLLTAKERRTFEQAFDFLWRVRAHFHLTAGRAEERLTFDLQPEVARRMGWSGRGEEPAVERFMRRYFLVARDVGGLTRALCAKLEEREQKSAQGLSRLLPGGRRRKPLSIEGFIEEGGRLSVTGPGVFREAPEKLMELFAAADRSDLDLHPDAFSAVTRSLELATPALRRDPKASKAFLDVLARGRQPYRVLSMMNETGLLGRFLPEFARVVGQTQFNMYHAYTVDEHTLQAIGIINDIGRGKLKDSHPLSSEVMPLIADREVLYLAMLLHDVGKGGSRGQLEDGAIAARRACDRLGLEPRRGELVAWLVRHHLALSDFAQKRDVSDPDTVRAFADLVGDPERLRMLLVMTVADIRAVGPGVWNGWKEQLIRELYEATGRAFRGESVTVPDLIAGHDALLRQARSQGAAARTRQRADLNTTELALAAQDRPGLFADIAEALAAAGADVAGARVSTAEDGTVIDVFQLQDGAGAGFGHGEPRRLAALARDIEAAALGKGAAAPAGSPAMASRRAAFDVRPAVIVDNRASAAATVVEVSGLDRPGLLAELARVFSRHGLSIRSAHVATFGERAVDAFYVCEPGGEKLTETRAIGRLRTALTRVLDQAPAAVQRGVTRARASPAR